ncbi:MAG: hypothetical protein M3Y33_06780 [Actinomycetota bacterium]|nr:hypothetical protein [Actinomycetota bacterium]
MVDQCEGPVRLYLTDGGVTCVEDFGSDTAQYLSAQRPGATPVAIDRSAGAQVGSGNFQVNYFYGDPVRAASDAPPDTESSRPRRERASASTAGPRFASFPAELTQRTIPLSDGLHAGTMLAIEVQAQHELRLVTAVMVHLAGPAGAATIPPPVRLYWHPSRDLSATIAQAASGFIVISRTGPLPPGAIMETPDQDLPWTLANGQWQVELQVTANGHPALHLSASFSVSPADGFPIQRIEWVTLATA